MANATPVGPSSSSLTRPSPLHYAPGSWLHQVEIWLGKIQPDLIAGGIFTSPSDLRRKMMSYIRLHNRDCSAFHWTYRNTKSRKPVNAS